MRGVRTGEESTERIADGEPAGGQQSRHAAPFDVLLVEVVVLHATAHNDGGGATGAEQPLIVRLDGECGGGERFSWNRIARSGNAHDVVVVLSRAPYAHTGRDPESLQRAVVGIEAQLEIEVRVITAVERRVRAGEREAVVSGQTLLELSLNVAG